MTMLILCVVAASLAWLWPAWLDAALWRWVHRQ